MIRGLECSDLQVEGGSCASEQKSIRYVSKSVCGIKVRTDPEALRTTGLRGAPLYNEGREQPNIYGHIVTEQQYAGHTP